MCWFASLRTSCGASSETTPGYLDPSLPSQSPSFLVRLLEIRLGPAREREAWSWCAILLVLLLDRRLDLCLLDVLHALLLRRRDGLGVLGAAGLGFDDGELFLRLDQVEDERVGAREDQGEDEARAVQVKVALCAWRISWTTRWGQVVAFVSRCAPTESLTRADAPERNLRLRKSDWVRMSGTAPGPPAVAVLHHKCESQSRVPPI